MAAMERMFNCMASGEEIKLERKPDNSGWQKWNKDGTKHVDFKKSNNNNAAQIAALANQVRKLKETVNILISQIQILRSDVKLLSSKK